MFCKSYFCKFTLNRFEQFNVADSGRGPNNGVTLDQWSDIRFISEYQKGDITRNKAAMLAVARLLALLTMLRICIKRDKLLVTVRPRSKQSWVAERHCY